MCVDKAGSSQTSLSAYQREKVIKQALVHVQYKVSLQTWRNKNSVGAKHITQTKINPKGNRPPQQDVTTVTIARATSCHQATPKLQLDLSGRWWWMKESRGRTIERVKSDRGTRALRCLWWGFYTVQLNTGFKMFRKVQRTPDTSYCSCTFF